MTVAAAPAAWRMVNPAVLSGPAAPAEGQSVGPAAGVHLHCAAAAAALVADDAAAAGASVLSLQTAAPCVLINTGAWLQEGLLMALHLQGPCLLNHHLETQAEHSTAVDTLHGTCWCCTSFLARETNM